MTLPNRPYSPTERLGVNAVERAFLSFNWIFREQYVADHGVDAEVEVCDDGVPTGRLLKLQIKSGSSWFSEQTADGIVFRDSARHFEYWFGHSLPVVITLYDPTSEHTWWEHVTAAKSIRTGMRYKILVPRNNILTALSAPAFRAIVGQPLDARTSESQPRAVEGRDMLTAINAATQSIDVASPRISTPLLSGITDAANRHIRVRLVIDPADQQTVDHAWHARHAGFNIDVRLLPTLHLKQIVIDHRVALYGSSLNPDASHPELIVETYDGALVRSMSRAFEKLWSEARAPNV